MAFELRDYQKELIMDIKKSMMNGNKKIMVQSPP
nr:MAG TPA: UvrABC system protein B [Caudoviricetes sp.]